MIASEALLKGYSGSPKNQEFPFTDCFRIQLSLSLLEHAEGDFQ